MSLKGNVEISVLFSFAFFPDIPFVYLYFILLCAKAHGLAHVCNRSG